MAENFPKFDLVIAGGGLAGTLTAALIRHRCPALTIAIVDGGGQRAVHTWSFHAKDLSPEALALISPLISKSWDSYSVRFPNHRRNLPLRYCSIQSESYWQHIDALLPNVTKITGSVDSIKQNSVELRDGRSVRFSAVLDARGITSETRLPVSGWQKFIGFEIETEEPHGIDEPLIMDATIKQQDGFRFFYVLPFAATKILIEDTYYSDNPALNSKIVEAEISAYIRSIGITHYKIRTRESGVLPIPLDDNYLFCEPEVPAIGMQGGFFHPTSGYSLPYTIRCAEQLAAGLSTNQKHEDLALIVRQIVNVCRKDHRTSSAFLIRLNRMLFRASTPEKRWKILAQFYRRNLSVISQFYSGDLGPTTKLAMICGVPPVPLFRGLWHFLARGTDRQDVGKAIRG